MPHEQIDVTYERVLDDTVRELRQEMAGRPAALVLPALVGRLEQRVPDQVPHLAFLSLVADVIAQDRRQPLRPTRADPVQRGSGTADSPYTRQNGWPTGSRNTR